MSVLRLILCLTRIGAEPLQELARHGPRDLAAAHQSFAIEQSDNAPGHIERAIDMERNIIDYGCVDDELPVAEEFHEPGIEKRIIRRAKLDRRRQAQTRQEIRSRKAPKLWPLPRRQKQAGLAFPRQIDEMEERCFGTADLFCIFDGKGRSRGESEEIRRGEIFGGIMSALARTAQIAAR